MPTKRTIVLLGLVVGFVSLLTTPATAQEGPSVMVHRVCTIAPGQDAGAVAFAREVADYIEETWPELQVVTFRPVVPRVRTWVIHPDGSRVFVMVKSDEGGAAGLTEVYLVKNWFEELRQRMGN